jgi:hypothetical protein
MVGMVGCSTRPSSCGNKHRRFRNSDNKQRERETLARIHAQLQHRVHLLTLSRAEATSVPNLALVLQGVDHWASGTALLVRHPLLQQSKKLVPIRPRRVIILYAPGSVTVRPSLCIAHWYQALLCTINNDINRTKEKGRRVEVSRQMFWPLKRIGLFSALITWRRLKSLHTKLLHLTP